MLGFRVWDKEKMVMIYDDDDHPVFFFSSDMQGDLNATKTTEPYCYSDLFIPMQSTGLFDSNGKEIYEGDILKDFNLAKGHPDELINVIDAITFLWVLGFNKEGSIQFRELGNYKIIGNICENPELLEKIK